VSVIRVNFNAYENGEQYGVMLADEANRIFKIFLSMLSSYWQSTIQGPSYTNELKAMSVELARIRLSLEDIRSDTQYSSTRTEFLYQVLTSVLFPREPGAPDPQLPDQQFKDLLLKVLEIYFNGSIPASMAAAAALFIKGEIKVTEAFLEARKPGSGYDISDQFGFLVNIILDSPTSSDVLLADKNIRILLSIIRPAHTLLRIKYVLKDEWYGQSDPDPNVDRSNKILDSLSMALSDYDYEDFRRFSLGVAGVDILGMKKSHSIVAEDHSSDF
jgi:hypothetical protein